MRNYYVTRDEFNDALQDYIGNMINFPKTATLMPLGDPMAAMSSGASASGASASGGLGALLGPLLGGGSTTASPGPSPGPSSGSSLGGLFSSLGSLFGGKGASKRSLDEAAQINMAMRALHGDYGLFDTTAPSPVLDNAKVSLAEPVKKNYQIPMIYFDDKAPPKEAWGKKFNALPLGSEKGTVMEYKDIVSLESE